MFFLKLSLTAASLTPPLTGDSQYWQKIKFQDLSGSNHEQSIKTVIAKLQSLIKKYNESKRESKRAKVEDPPIIQNEPSPTTEKKEEAPNLPEVQHNYEQENLKERDTYQRYLIMVEEEGGEQKAFKELKALHDNQKLDGNLYPLLAALNSKKADPIKKAKIDLSNRIKDIDEANIPYALIPSNQPEERWRWRQHFNVKVYSLNGHSHKIIDFSGLHHTLSQTLNSVQETIGVDEDANIIIPAISIVYENEEEAINERTSMIKWIPKEDSYCVFISGLKYFTESSHNIHGVNYEFITGNSLNLVASSIRGMAESFYSIIPDEKLSQFRNFIYSVTQSNEKDLGTTLGTYFNHSEQWLINYLLRSYVEKYGFSQYGNLCSIIENIIINLHDIKKINKIIFHLRSKNDICDVCSPTLSLFLEKLNSNLMLIGNLLTQHTRFKDLFAPGTKFFIITSSHKQDLKQAIFRKHYHNHNEGRHGQRRANFGRDRNSKDMEKPIEIKEGLPYSYVQIPVDKDGSPAKLDS